MKNIKKIIGLFIMMTLFAGCSNYVDFDPHSEYMVTEVDFLKTETDYRQMAVSCYSPMQWITHQPLIYGDLATTNSVAGGNSATDALIFQNIDDYTLTPATQNAEAVNLWRFTYEGINRVNYMVQHKDQNPTGQKIDFAGKDALYGELYFIRAYEYFMLARNFGDAIVFTDKRVEIADFGNMKRAPKADVYKQIEVDLNAAIAVLPTTAAQKGRVTKYAAQALLGKVLLYENKLPEAAAMLENVVNGPFSLVPDFGSQFLLAGENGRA
jgi:starch-binding outer membrane protein, SusD/RagB family